MGKPSGWVSFREADVVHYLDDDFLQFELKPLLSRNLFGQPFLTNAFGMHDGPISLEKPYGTMRIAVLGSSMDMGWGVKYQETYINKLEQWLDRHAERNHLSPPRRFEVLNFAVAAYSPMQRLEVLRRKVMAFDPDLVVYSATTLDLRLMEIHLCDMLRKNVDMKYDFMSPGQDACSDRFRRRSARPRWRPAQNKDRLKKKLRPLYWWLYDVTLGAIAARLPLERRAARDGNHPASGQSRPPVAPGRAGGPAPGAGPSSWAPVFDLSDTFDQIDPAKLEIAAWDDHPNVVGHHRLFLALARALVKDQEIYQLLFSPGERAQDGRSRAAQLEVRGDAKANARRVAQLRPPRAKNLPKFDKIVVCDQDDALAQ